MSDDAQKFFAPDAAFIQALAQAAVADLPVAFRAQASLASVSVQDFVSDADFEAMGLEDPYELTSLCQNNPTALWLFRRPILDEWSERGDICLADLVTQILVLELADHFGWGESDIAAYPSLSVSLSEAKRRLTGREG
jgi:predicted Zn-dependent protease with MMP-like domain